jgi:hypothetical protein
MGFGVSHYFAIHFIARPYGHRTIKTKFALVVSALRPTNCNIEIRKISKPRSDIALELHKKSDYERR